MKIQQDKQTDYQDNTIFSPLLALPTLKQMVDCLIDEAISRTNNITEASKLLGISRQSLSKRIKRAKA